MIIPLAFYQSGFNSGLSCISRNERKNIGKLLSLTGDFKGLERPRVSYWDFARPQGVDSPVLYFLDIIVGCCRFTGIQKDGKYCIDIGRT